MKLQDVFQKYHNKLDHLDLELLVAHSLKKTREFVITYPDHIITKKQETITKNFISRRLKHEPIAYILGEKEFYGLNFKVDKNTLIPRPETELLVEQALRKIQDTRNPVKSEADHGAGKKQEISIIDLGTGSGNIIIAIAKNSKFKIQNSKFFAVDISAKALKVAKQNAKINKVEKKIKFVKSNLLDYFLNSKNKKLKTKNCIIIANLPYLSKKIYNATMPDVKNFEPKSALLSGKDGLDHYRKLFSQIKKLPSVNSQRFTIFLEFSPEQKKDLDKLAKNFFPKAKRAFYKDLSQKWRILEIKS